MNKWIIYNLIVGFAVYWASNLLLWYPWSYSAALGVTIMLTVSPLIWAYSIFLCIKTFPSSNLYKAALINAALFLPMAMLMDFVFFGIIRGAKEELLQATTFYGYGFVIVLPFLEVLFARKLLAKNWAPVKNKNIRKAALTGLFCFTSIVAIIVFEIEI